MQYSRSSTAYDDKTSSDPVYGWRLMRLAVTLGMVTAAALFISNGNSSLSPYMKTEEYNSARDGAGGTEIRYLPFHIKYYARISHHE